MYPFSLEDSGFSEIRRKVQSHNKKQNYKIIGTNSVDYTTDTSKWREIYKPKNEMCVKNTRGQTENEDEETPKDKFLTGVCLLKFKKI